ncbi:hypothetical protein FHG64_08800 [Antarcticibacterium flavum]|uniref:Uncharacterized protein n=1 Tax=Antarcticibacterium flavum TaxID=2058175 RepID=A0A5B7X2I3_9FLAO|nr:MULTISPECIES: hypothetical protein [Antarcticibacterium]MCM4159076.1 hypothetical protein [Antarcticibacterium sp. W02-3]QCY69480.1 hypothetical protein FHG64_08800 [Antarcticibacterium flavum]
MKIFLSFSLFVGVFASCEQMAQIKQEVTREQLDQQLVAIEALIEEGSCTENSQCRFIPYGSKACGGPQGYLIFSSNVDVDELQTKVDAYTKAEATYNKQEGIMSDCSIPPEPAKLGCVDGNCVQLE